MRFPKVSVAAFAGLAALAACWQASAQEIASAAETPIGQLISKHESFGGENVPNFRWDRTHTAGGPFQITDTNWRHYAPMVGIDIARYPNAMSAPRHEQGQVLGMMLHYEGTKPWTCCNPKLAAALASPKRGDAPVERDLAVPQTPTLANQPMITVPANPFVKPAQTNPETVFSIVRTQ